MTTPLTAGLPAAQQPSVIAIPGSGPRRTVRRSATNPHAHLTVYVVPDASLAGAPHALLNVAVKSNSRLLGLSLKGHTAPVVDLEFLQTPLTDRIHVLGSCDEKADVFLWFLYVERDGLGVPMALRLLRKYSFYTLRKSVTAYYTRIRLAGSAESGTMVLVPNDGGNCRVVTFHCEPSEDGPGNPDVPVIAPPPGSAPLQIAGAQDGDRGVHDAGDKVLEAGAELSENVDDGVGGGVGATEMGGGGAAVDEDVDGDAAGERLHMGHDVNHGVEHVQYEIEGGHRAMDASVGKTQDTYAREGLGDEYSADVVKDDVREDDDEEDEDYVEEEESSEEDDEDEEDEDELEEHEADFEAHVEGLVVGN